MENGSFQNLNLSSFDFIPDNQEDNKKEKAHALANQLPSQGTSSFQTLMSQNEDLVARLRVTLQRLSSLEQQNHQLQQNYDSARTQSSAVLDQLLIWKEKEKIWKEKEQSFERSHRDETRELSIEIDLLRQKTSQLEKSHEDLDRYRKYHEKIKTSVKPYIQKLKNYAKSLYEQTQSLNSSLIAQELQIAELKQKLEAAREGLQNSNALFQAQKNELISMFEDERQHLKSEISNLQQSQEVLTEKTRSLDRSLERQDELENLIVALRRSREELISSHHLEITSLKKDGIATTQELQTLRLRLEDQLSLLHSTQGQLKTSEVNASEYLEQLTSMRYLWSEKTQENERLKLSLSSLEKLNLELSQKLKSLRDQA